MAKLKLRGKVTIDQLLDTDGIVDMVNEFMAHRFEVLSAAIVWYDKDGVAHYDSTGTKSQLLWALENYKQVLLTPESEDE